MTLLILQLQEVLIKPTNDITFSHDKFYEKK